LKDERVAAQWYRDPNENDVVPWSSDMPDRWRRFHWLRPGTPEWNNISVPVPMIDEKVIVFAQVAPSGERNAADFALNKEPSLTLLRIRGVFAYTETNIATLQQYMGRTDWPTFIMIPLYFIVLALSVSASVFFAISFNKEMSSHLRKLGRGTICIVSSFSLWMLYEYGNVTGGIRIDLLLLFPLFFLSGVLLILSGIVCVFKKIRKKSQPAH
jgi:hypothetical protein